MSTGKRLAKRSILGTRVACCLPDGKFYPAVIVDVRARPPEDLRSSVYKVRVEGERKTYEVSESELVGSGFSPVNAVRLRSGQKVYITHNNREVSATVVCHAPNSDEVVVSVNGSETPGTSAEEVRKRLEDVRLLESRKSARLADQDTDFAKLADVSTDRKRPPGGPSSGRTSPATGSSSIDVPGSTPIPMGSRKRRSSRCGDEDTMDECAAALVLMKLSCSPRSALFSEAMVAYDMSGASSSSSSGVWSTQSPHHNVGRSATPSPPLSDPSPAPTDDGLELDDSPSYEDESGPRKRRSSTRTMFQCTWRECRELAESCPEIESHIRRIHLGLSDRRRSRSLSSLHSTSDSDSEDDHEEDFYWTEVEVTVATNVDPATVCNSVVGSRLSTATNVTAGSQAAVSAAPLPIPHTTVISSPQSQVMAKPQPPKTTSIITINSSANAGLHRTGLASSLPNSQTMAASTLLTLHADTSSPTARGGQPVKMTSPTSPHHHSVIHRSSPSPLGGGPRTNLSTHPYLQGGGWTSSSLSRAPATKSSVLKYSGGAPPYSQVSSPPTLSHMDMARPPHEDPEYRRRLHGGGALLSSSWDSTSSYLTQSNEAVGAGGGKVRVTSSPKASPGRVGRRGGESKKCRKFYGMDQKNDWCTQCKWKKACTRFANGS